MFARNAMRLCSRSVVSVLLLVGGCGGSPGGGGPSFEPVTDLRVPVHLGAASAAACGLRAGETPPTPEGPFLERGVPQRYTRPRCVGVRHALAGAGGSTVRVSLLSWEGASGARMRLLDLLDQELSRVGSAGSGASLDVTLARSGELFVELEPLDPQAPPNGYELQVTCLDGCDLKYTRYPIVLMHGMMGTDTYINILEYFYQIPETLRAAGYEVENPAVPGVSTAEVRAAAWQAHLDDLQAQGIGRRFNLIAHSQGGLDARYLISGLGDPRPVSLITVATPHRGSQVADLALGLIDDSRVTQSLYDNVMGELADLLGLGPAEATEQLISLSTPAMVGWNDRVPNSPNVYYASWSGRSCGALEPACQQQENGEVVNVLLGPSYTLLEMLAGDNDGMVPDSSAQWGVYMGAVPADHMDEVGQIANSPDGPFNHLAFYLDQAQMLSDLGF